MVTYHNIPGNAYTAPIAQSFANIAKAFTSGPSPLEQQLYAAKIGQANAATTKDQMATRAPQTIADAIAKAYGPLRESARPAPTDVGPMPQMTRGQQVQSAIPELSQGVAQAGKIGDLGSTLRAIIANQGGAGDQVLTDAMLGAGANYQDTPVGSREKPIVVGAGGTAFGVPNDPRFGGAPALHGTPTMSTVQGGLLGDNFGNLGALNSYQRKAIGAEPSGGIQVSPDGTITIGGPLTKSTVNDLQKDTRALTRFKGMLDSTTNLVSASPDTNFGIPGRIKGAVQDTGTILDGISKSLGYSDAATARSKLAQEALKSGVSADIAMGLFDPKLPALKQSYGLLVYSAASALAGQSGRSVSDKDIKQVEKIVGNPEDFWMNKQKSLSMLASLGDFYNVLSQSDQAFTQGKTADVGTPSSVSAQPGGDIPQISSDEEYNALPSGTVFTDPEGNRRTKP